MTHLQEAISVFRALQEGLVGSYVTTADGVGGYVISADGGRLAVEVINQPHKKASVVWVDRIKVKVNPGGAP